MLNKQIWPDLPHFSSPYSDFARFQEAEAYERVGLSPYFPGSPVHLPPLLVQLYSLLNSWNCIWVLFVLCDCISAYCIKHLVKGNWSWALYWLNPVTALNCAMCNSSSLCHALALSFFWTTRRKSLASGQYLAILAYIDPSFLPLGFAWCFANESYQILVTFIPTSAVLYGVTFFATNSWGFLNSCQGAILLNTEICTNIGLSWYVLLEMFIQYQSLYRVLLAVHPWFYIYPLTQMLKRHKAFSDSDTSASLYFAFSFTISVVLHSHPLLADLVVALILLLSHTEILAKTKSAFVTVSGLGIGLLWSYWMWLLWARRLSGNANFFYFQTIIYNVMLVGLVVGMVHSVNDLTRRRRNYLMCKELVSDLVAKVN